MSQFLLPGLCKRLTRLGLKSQNFFHCGDCVHRHTFPEDSEGRTNIEQIISSHEEYYYLFELHDILLSEENLIKLFGEQEVFFCPVCEEKADLGHGEDCPIKGEVLGSTTKAGWEAQKLIEMHFLGEDVEAKIIELLDERNL